MGQKAIEAIEKDLDQIEIEIEETIKRKRELEDKQSELMNKLGDLLGEE